MARNPRPCVCLTAEADAPPWGLELGTGRSPHNHHSHGPRLCLLCPAPSAAESCSPGFREAPVQSRTESFDDELWNSYSSCHRSSGGP